MLLDGFKEEAHGCGKDATPVDAERPPDSA